jgi:hypothetical protein
MREREAGAVARQHLVHGEAVDDGDPLVVPQDLAALLSGFAGQDAIEGDGRRVHAPDRTRGRLRRAHDGPARFVDIDHRRCKRSAPERRIRRFQVTSDCVKLIPERLRLHGQALPRHHPYLAFEGQMIRVLRDGDADAEFGGIPPAGDDLRGPRRRDHRAVAGAAVLLADMMLDLVRQLDRRDPVRVLVWPAIAVSAPPHAGHAR